MAEQKSSMIKFDKHAINSDRRAPNDKENLIDEVSIPAGLINKVKKRAAAPAATSGLVCAKRRGGDLHGALCRETERVPVSSDQPRCTLHTARECVCDCSLLIAADERRLQLCSRSL